jgi:hypothetical protein
LKTIATAAAPPWRALGHVALALAGICAIAWIVLDAGPARMLEAVLAAKAAIAVVFVLEGVRIACDAVATRLLLGRSVPVRLAFRAQLAAYPATTLLPAGRTAGEALKAAILRHHVGLERAAAAGVVLPGLLLLGTAVASVPAIAAVYALLGWSALTGAVVAQALTAAGLGTALLVAARRPGLGKAVGRLSHRVGVAVSAVQQVLRSSPRLPLAPLAAAIANRALLVAQVLIVASATGAATTAAGGLAVAGTHFVGAAAGDVVPGQLGVTDAAQALAAGDLGAATAAAVAVALVLHAVQIVWVVAGGAAALGRRPGDHSG